MYEFAYYPKRKKISCISPSIHNINSSSISKLVCDESNLSCVGNFLLDVIFHAIQDVFHIWFQNGSGSSNLPNAYPVPDPHSGSKSSSVFAVTRKVKNLHFFLAVLQIVVFST